MAWITNRPIGLTHKSEDAFEGYTIFCSVTGHHATMVDMEGQIVQQWQHDEGIQHLKLLENGNLLIQTSPLKEGQGGEGREKSGGSAGAMIELSPTGETVWEHRDTAQHHDYVRLESGNTVYLAWEPIPKDVAAKIKGGHHHEDDPEFMWGDVVREVTPSGDMVREWNSWEHFDFDEDVICPLESHKEWTHANSLEVLANGDWLISFRLTSTVAIVNPDSGDIVWRWGPNQVAENHDLKKWGSGELSHQHNAHMLENGNILVFDNGCHRKRGPSFSRIIEIDKETREFVWTFQAPTILAFYSFMVSGCQRLPNGNTLITEGASGRILEVTKDKEVVWEYISPWMIPSKFGETPAVFRSYRIAPDDPRLANYSLSREPYAELNKAIADGVVQSESDYDHGFEKDDDEEVDRAEDLNP